MRGLISLAWRFAVGAPLSGVRRTDATFSRAGRAVLASRVPGWWHREPGRWSYLPGWQRAAARWSVVVLLVLWLWSPLAAVVVLAVSGGLAAWRYVPRWRRAYAARAHRSVVAPLWVAAAAQLGLDPEVETADKWLSVPETFRRDPDTVVTLHLPAQFEAAARQRAAVDALVRARLGGEWESHWRTADYQVTYTRPAHAPRYAPWALSDNEYRPYVGQSKTDRPIHVGMESESPHVLVAAGTGAGKTSTLMLFVAHALLWGWTVDIIDPKRRSFLILADVPGVRIHTDIVSMVRALEGFYLSMDGINAAVSRGEMDPAGLPRRLLIIDEMSSFMDMARNHYRRSGGKGDVPIGLQVQYLALQGRQAEHRMVVAPHQPDAKVFGGTAVRGSFAARIVTGSMTRTLWMTAFGYQKEIKYDSRNKGRGLIALGEGDPRELQIAHIRDEDIPSLLANAPAPPEWFTRGDLPPWVTAETIEQAATVAGVGWTGDWHPSRSVDVSAGPAGVPDQRPGGVSHPEPVVSHPAEIAVDVPGHVTPTDSDTSISQGESVSQSVTSGARLRLVRPDDDPPLIVGLAAAARFLGYEKPESFRRARSREPIPGETRSDDGRPAWRPEALRSWQSKRVIAGGRPTPGAATEGKT